MVRIHDSTVAFKGQIYSELKKEALLTGNKFTDPEFPPNNKSLFCDGVSESDIEWKRPQELCSEPRLFVDGVNTRDLVQGELGNCWLVAACSCIALHQSIWSQILPDAASQNWSSRKDHPGIFHFRFWRFGSWTDVVIDDYLPTRDGKLVFLHSPEQCEFWSALLEKAYAKLFGCYEALNNGELVEALEDFTGGVSETCNLTTDKRLSGERKIEEFYDYLQTAAEHRALLCASITAETEDEMNQMTSAGLIKGHAYAVTAVRRIRIRGTAVYNCFNREKLSMIRLRNPWGDSEWNGAFSDGSQEWTNIMKVDRQAIGLVFENDGEFWMTFCDFCQHFMKLAICHRVNTSVMSLQKRWHETHFHSHWIAPHRAGGCLNNRDTFLNNPQFMFCINDEKTEVMFELTQKTQRAKVGEKLTMGFTIMKVELNREFRVHTIQTVVISSSYRNSRSVFWRDALTPGRYVLLACIFEPGLTGDFLLRGFGNRVINFRELTQDKPPKSDSLCSCLPRHRYPCMVSRIKVIKATGLKRSDKKTEDIDTFCVISCETEQVETPVVKSCAEPEWHTAAIFYRRNPAKYPILLQVFQHNAIGLNDLLGCAMISDLSIQAEGLVIVQMLGGNVDGENIKCSRAKVAEGSRITVELFNNSRLNAL